MFQEADETNTFQPMDFSSLESINNEVETFPQPLAKDRPTNYIAPSDGDLAHRAGECILAYAFIANFYNLKQCEFRKMLTIQVYCNFFSTNCMQSYN